MTHPQGLHKAEYRDGEDWQSRHRRRERDATKSRSYIQRFCKAHGIKVVRVELEHKGASTTQWNFHGDNLLSHWHPYSGSYKLKKPMLRTQHIVNAAGLVRELALVLRKVARPK